MTALQNSIVSIKASLALALCFTGSANAFAQNNNADLIYQLQQLQEEVRQLRGLVEQQAFELENVKRLQSDQYSELDERVRSNSQLAATAPAVDNNPIVTSGGEIPVDVSVPAVELREPLQDERVIAAIDNDRRAANVTPSTAIAASPEDEKQAYEQAFSALKDLRYAESARQFRSFIDQYPNSDYADNAQYWLGESYYAAGNYQFALEAFNTLLQDYSDSSKYADALLKIGYTQYEQQQWPQARAALEQVAAQYPGTSLARLAESRLRSMRLEGRF